MLVDILIAIISVVQLGLIVLFLYRMKSQDATLRRVEGALLSLIGKLEEPLASKAIENDPYYDPQTGLSSYKARNKKRMRVHIDEFERMAGDK